MVFVRLEAADIYRDGGSYGATLRTADGTEYQLWLECCDRYTENCLHLEGLHHRWLFAYSGPVHTGVAYSPGVPSVPIETGSVAERELLEALRTFIEGGPGTTPEYPWRRLTEMFSYILVREPYFVVREH